MTSVGGPSSQQNQDDSINKENPPTSRVSHSLGRTVKTREPLKELTNHNNKTEAVSSQTLQSPPEPRQLHKQRDWKAMKKDLTDHHDLLKHSKELKKSSESKPLLHFNPASLNAKDLYMSDKVVFKPGVEEAVMSKMGYMVTWMAGLQNAVVPAKQGTATVISREDQDEQGRDKTYAFARVGSTLKIIDSSTLSDIGKKDKITAPVSYEKDGLSISVDNRMYRLRPVTNGFSVTMPLERLTAFDKLLEETEFSQVTNADGDSCAAANSQIFEIDTEDGNEFVTIDGIRYEAVEDPDEEGYFNLEFAGNGGQAANEEVTSKQYQQFSDFDGNSVLISTDDYYPYDPDEGELTAQNKSYTVEELDGELTITSTEDDAFVKEHRGDEFILIEQGEKSYLVQPDMLDSDALEDASNVIEKGIGHQTVIRNGQEYQLEQSKEGIKVIGKEIKGMMQSKVPNVFMRPSEEKGTVNVNKYTKEANEVKKAFYERIPMDDYADALLASLLLRPQDGKIESLDESNVLFSAQPNTHGIINPQDPSCSLRPVLIDLDETMPADNAHFITDKGEKVCAVRLGLMGFPHATQPLDDNEKKHVLEKIGKILDEKDSLIANLEIYLTKPTASQFVKQENIDAFKEVLEHLEAFTKTHPANQEWNLQSLCFAVLPEYGRQWTEAMAINPEKIPPEELAAVIGKNSFDQIKSSMSKRYGT